MKPKSMRWWILSAAVLVAALPMLAIAEDQVPVADAEQFRGEKFFDLALCAVSIAAAPSGLGLWVAGLSCGKALYVWYSE